MSLHTRTGPLRWAPLLAVFVALVPVERVEAQAVPGICPIDLATETIVSHDFSTLPGGGTVSYCELCGIGTVRLEVVNPFSTSEDVGDFADLVVTENLLDSGLTYVPNSTVFSTSNVPGGPPSVVQPALSGTNNSVLTWTIDSSFFLEARNGGPGNKATLTVEFQVQRASPPLDEEGLIGAIRDIQGSAAFTPECGLGSPYLSLGAIEELPLREPVPQITKQGRNLDANQTAFANTVYGHRHDDVIWRIQVTNVGLAPLEDVIVSDVIGPGFEFNYVCPSNATAASAANNGAAGSCTALGGTDTITDLALADVLGIPASTAAPSATVAVYLVGRITDSCISGSVNTVSDIEWGCAVDTPPGGISQTSTGFIPSGDTATFNTNPTPAGLNVNVVLSGTNLTQPMGAKGTVTVTVSNQTGGTVRDIRLRDLLPAEFVIDPTFTPTVAIARPGGFGATYAGMINTITWTNPQAGTYLPFNTTDPADPLANTELTFELTSTTTQTIHDPDPDSTRYTNMLRHGDVMTVRFRTILIDAQYYDKVANIDVTEEAPGSDPPDTDPTETFQITNELEIWFEELCTGTEHNPVPTVTIDDAEPEDLDVDTSAIIYILTNTDSTPLTVDVTNNGGHDADDYFVYVSFGNAMVVDTAPAGCSATTNLPTIRGSDAPLWTLPEPVPPSASIYVCDVGVIAPGSTRSLTFDVVKNPNPAAEDDLMFRADVIGEIWLSNPDGNGNQALWFPTPTVRSPEDGLLDLANNYTLDAVRARVLGFNLTKAQLGTCTENNPPPGSPDDDIQIGEECSFHIETGGWFGFDTAGFDYIGVWDIAVDDLIPDGQGYISQDAPVVTQPPEIKYIALTPPPAPISLAEDTFGWTFNTVDADVDRIDEKDHWFSIDVSTRLLNDPIDTSAIPNLHAELSTNIMLSTFEAIFENPLTGDREYYEIDDNVVGYPPEFRRRVDLTVTEPNLIVTKEVCNETIYGTGPACTNFVALADDGDAYDTYIYRIAVANEASAGGVPRAPAYDVTITSTTDPSDMLFVDPLTGDALDNDADSLVDGADAAGEGSITDNVTQNAVPAQIVASYTHSDDLLRIDAGETVYLYYRVDPDDDVAPLQQLVSEAYATYDSLEGDFGNQTSPQSLNGEIGGARQYESVPGAATIRIIPVETIPKQILATSNTPLSAPVSPQPIAIGEELEFELRTQIPVSQLRNFMIRDELPVGMSCAEAPAVDLDAAPYDAGGFVPGGVISPSCTPTEVVWDFGNQTVTQAPGGANRFDFGIQFIARIDNAAGNQDGSVLTNGGTATVTEVTYIDELNNAVTIEFDSAAVVIREPTIELEKLFAVPEADASDIVTVTINATNNGSLPAYNLRVLDDLTGTQLSYVGNVAGDDPPVTVDTTTYGPDAPLFGWDPGFAIAPGDTASFTFDVQLADDVETLEIITNTVQASWTSLPGQDTALNSTGLIGPDGDATGMRNGALPNAGDTLNDYEDETDADITVRAPTLAKTDVDPALAPEIGAHKPFQVDIYLAEGVSSEVAATDNLDTGSVSYVLADNADFDVTYQFSGITTINGQPPDVGAFNAVPPDGASGPVTWDIGAVVTETEDDSTVNAIDPRISIYYYARINNDLVTDAGDPLQNSVDLTFLNGETGATEVLNATTPPIAAIEPNLIATKVLTNVTPGKAPADPLALNDIAEYVVTIDNIGSATAYDVNIVDTLPLELALYGGVPPTATIDGLPVASFVATPAGAPAGPLVWGRDNGDESLDLPPTSFIELTYQVLVVAQADPGTTVDNNVWVDWTSLAGPSAYQRTGDGCPSWAAPNDYCFGPAVAAGDPVAVDPPEALEKANTQATASIGEVFTYRITVPSVPHTVPLYDVRITDDLTASAANLTFVSVARVAGSGSWSPVNTGSATTLVIEDPIDGIDIPANEQIVIDIAVVVDDTPTNVDGLLFTNTATYGYNRLDGNPASARPGYPDTSDPMTIVEPVVTLEKDGPAQMRIGLPGTFTLDVHNTTLARAWGLSVTDLLPETADTGIGGMCDAGVSALSVQIFEADGVTPVSAVLTEGSDYSVSFDPAPACLLTVTMLSAAATVGPDERLIVGYQASLDTDSEQDATLINIAGATQWYSGDSAGAYPVRSYTRTVTDGTPATPDHEDAYLVTVNLPVLRFEKTVANLSTGETPGTVATPGDLLRYSLYVENLGNVPITGFSIVDELDRLNAASGFQPGTLNVVTLPPGADASNTNASGGAAGTGLLDIRNVDIGGLGETVLIEFEVVLAPVIADGTYVFNQSQLYTGGFLLATSDDPNVNGPADPGVLDDDDPTQILIESAPYFDVDKISAYVTGDPTVLLAGETLRYTITVANVGTDNATDAMLRDNLPANTVYVAGSTTLNGASVPEPTPGVLPLIVGIPINAPGNTTPGALAADALAPPSHVATIVFDVVVDPDLLDGTILSNQGFVSAPGGGVLDRPSDDPRTPVVDDPTRDIVGNLPLIFATKSAALQIDLDNPNVVDPGDVLRYTITIYNNGAVPATDVVLSDLVPLNTTYVEDSTTLNGLGVGRPDGGFSPLAGGFAVSSSDLTPPLPVEGDGMLTAGQAAVVQFDLRVDDGVPAGTLIINQATVSSYEVPNVLTDGDGNPATGPEPTVVVVGAGQALAISKQVSVVGGGPAVAGATLEYLVRVINIGAVPASYIEITDDLDMVTPNYLQYVAGSATMNGSTDGVTFLDPVITADYAATYGDLAAGGEIVLRFQAVIDPTLAIGTIVTNNGVVKWNDPPQYAEAGVSIAVGGIPGIGILNGTAWHDSDFNNVRDPNERLLEGWTVDLYRNDERIFTTFTAPDGAYRFLGVPPNYGTADIYELRFVAPGAGANTALLGLADSAFTDYLQRIDDIVVQSGSNLLNMNLPIDPNGVVYNSVTRTPLPGAMLTLVESGSGAAVPPSCFDDTAQQDQVTRADGYYKFDLNFAGPGCSSGGNYLIQVSSPSGAYVAGYSEIIPPTAGPATAPLSVPLCAGTPQDAIPTTAQYCEAQPSEFAPPTSIAARAAGTEYYVHLTLDGAQPPGSAQIFNNHIPIDPELFDAVSISKTTPLVNVNRGQLIPYTIVVNSEVDFDLQNLTIADRFPAGFRYIADSARIDGTAAEPDVNGRELIWSDLGLTGSGRHTLQLLLAVGGGVSEGEYVNRAQALHSLTGNALSGEASATVRLVPDPTFDCTDVMGKVFNDSNRNGTQDLDEAGIGGVRLVTATGLAATTDAYGRYHITCATVPREGRGSNFVIKLDDRTLPSGFRLSTPLVQIERATRGKALSFNFGASIHRIVGLDIADPVFEPGLTELRPQWQPRINLLLEELRREPATLRLSYLADVEDPSLVDARVAAIKERILGAWQALNCCYQLVVEPEIFWRRGGPPDRPRNGDTTAEARE